MKRISLAVTVLSTIYGSYGCLGARDGENTESQTEAIVSGAPYYAGAGGDTCTVSRPDGTYATTMHCCPSGMAMVGFGPQTTYGPWYNSLTYFETLKCKSFTGNGTRSVDISTQRSFPSPVAGGAPISMHACPFGSVMVGIHLGLNRFACERNAKPILSGVDGETFSGQSDSESANRNVRTCGNQNSPWAMSGYRNDMGKLGCANDTPPGQVP